MRHTNAKEAPYTDNGFRSTVGLRSRDINAFHTVQEFLHALIEEQTQKALDISAANPDLKAYFNYAVQQFASHGKNATLA